MCFNRHFNLSLGTSGFTDVTSHVAVIVALVDNRVDSISEDNDVITGTLSMTSRRNDSGKKPQKEKNLKSHVGVKENKESFVNS